MLKSLFRSTKSNVFVYLVSTVITFIMTPIYVRELGNYDYGIWELIISVIGYLGLIDIGLRPTISRFMAFHRSDSAQPEAREIYSTSMAMMTLVGAIVSILIVIWSVVAPDLLAQTSDSEERYALVLRLMAISMIFSFPMFALESVLEGRLNYTTKNNINILHMIAGATVLYVYMPIYDPLILLSGVTAFAAFSKFTIFYIVVRSKQYGGFVFQRKEIHLSQAVKMIKFSLKSFAQGIAGKLSDKANVLIIGGFLGPQFIVFFSIPYTLLSRVNSFTLVLGHALMPTFSTLHSTGDNKAVDKYFIAGTRVMLAIIYPGCIGVAVIGESFIRLWIGADYADAARPILITLVCSMLISGSLPLQNRLLTALDKHGSLAILYSIRATINIILAIILVKPMGLLGVALAILLAHILITPWVWRAVFLHIESSAYYHLRQNVLPILFAAICMGIIVYAFQHYVGIQSWNELMMAIALGGLFFPLFSVIFVMNKEDRHRIRTAWNHLF